MEITKADLIPCGCKEGLKGLFLVKEGSDDSCAVYRIRCVVCERNGYYGTTPEYAKRNWNTMRIKEQADERDTQVLDQDEIDALLAGVCNDPVEKKEQIIDIPEKTNEDNKNSDLFKAVKLLEENGYYVISAVTNQHERNVPIEIKVYPKRYVEIK